MRNRVLALLAAAVFVVGAVLLRGALADGGDDEVSASDSTAAPAVSSGTILCIEELREVCATLTGDVVVEAAGATVTRLSTSDDRDDVPAAWVTLGPFPAIVDENRGRAGLDPLFTDTTLAGTSTLVFVVRKDRSEALLAHCGGDITWRCVGDSAGRPWADLGGEEGWGTLKPSHDPPDPSARGAVVFSAAVTSWFGNTDVTRNDFANEEFLDWATQLERAVPSFGSATQSALERFVIIPATYDIVATTAVEANALAGPDTARGAGFTIYPSPMGEAQAVVAGAGELPDLPAAVRTALVDSGWTPADGEAPAQVPGLPAPGVVEALRTNFWKEVS